MSFSGKARTVLVLGTPTNGGLSSDNDQDDATRDRGPRPGLVHSTKAPARAKAEAKVERKMIYVRDEMTDEVEFVVRPDGIVCCLQPTH